MSTFNIIVLVHTLAFIVYWLTNRLYHSAVNDYLADLLKLRLNYVGLLVTIAALVGLWSLLRIILTALMISRFRFDPVYIPLAIFFLILFYGSFIYLFKQDRIQLSRLGMLIFYYRLFVDPLILIGVCLLLRQGLIRWGSAPAGWLLQGVCILCLLAIWSLPAAYPPIAVYHGPVPPKPRIIAHRGAAMLAPENTLVSAQLAQALGAYGLEVDIRLSLDGVPFLMHDEDLSRTTNVAALYPGRENEPAENFTWAELQKLKAGTWFIESDPFGTIARGEVTQGQVERYRRERIPSLAEILDFLQQNEMVFIFDLSQPAQGHPYRESYFDVVLDLLSQSGLGERIWYLLTPTELDRVTAKSTGMAPAYGGAWREFPSPQSLAAKGYKIANSEYDFPPEWITPFHRAGLMVNLWTVDEPWIFSRQWLLGVDSMTTNNVKGLAGLAMPLFSMVYSRYLVIWIFVGLVGLGIILNR